MHILALETSGTCGKTALLRNDEVLAEAETPLGGRVAKELAPTIATLVRSAGLKIVDIALIGVSIGPGLFTGLRFGVSTAKTLAYALKVPIFGAATFDAIACQAPPRSDGGSLLVIADAYRGQLFSQEFQLHSGSWRATGVVEISQVDRWLEKLDRSVSVTGPFVERLSGRLPEYALPVRAELRDPKAAAIGRLARNALLAGVCHDPMQLAPLYVRPSAAEEKALLTGNGPAPRQTSTA